jgi:hypothetical protein
VIGYIKRFWTWLVSLAAVGGLYVGAVAIKATTFFWIAIPVALILAGIRPTLHGLGEIIVRIRNYPALLRRVAQAERQMEELESNGRNLKESAEDARKLGRKQAYSEFRGWIIALGSQPPKIVGIADDDGVIALVGEQPTELQPAVGARYSVRTSATGRYRGSVEISRIDAKTGFVLMRCIEAAAAEFWQHLIDRVSYDDSAPANIILDQYEIDLQLPNVIDEPSGKTIHEVTSD